MPENPLKPFEKLDPELLKLIDSSRQLALSDGALPRKFKLLMVLAFDAAHGEAEGVKVNAERALQAGATKQEIAEALRVTQFVTGVGAIFTAAHALKDLV